MTGGFVGNAVDAIDFINCSYSGTVIGSGSVGGYIGQCNNILAILQSVNNAVVNGGLSANTGGFIGHVNIAYLYDLNNTVICNGAFRTGGIIGFAQELLLAE